MVTGSYHPGIVTIFKGTKKGFMPGEVLEQEGYISRGNMDLPYDNPKSYSYWNFTSVKLGDFNKDGLTDLFIGGSGGIRVSLNKGTKTNPKFGLRKMLLDLEGKPLTVAHLSDEKIAMQMKYKAYCPAHSYKTYVQPCDWDNDGVMDLLVTSAYSTSSEYVVNFFKGVKTKDGIRFQDRQKLFYAKDGGKTFPGSTPMINIVDYNNDGKKDLLLGLSIMTHAGEYVLDEINKIYEADQKPYINQAGKDPGEAMVGKTWNQFVKDSKANYEEYFKKMKERRPDFDRSKVKLPEHIDENYPVEKRKPFYYLHRGFVYVMLGK